MDVWILIREEGYYSDYGMAVLAVSTSADEALRLASECLRQKYEREVAACEENRERWRNGGFHPWVPAANRDRPAEVVYRMPEREQVAWEPHPTRPEEWHAKSDDIRWSIFKTQLDALAPDANTFQANDL